MKVKMNLNIFGEAPVYGLPTYSFTAGDIVDIDERLATAWLESGHASRVEQSPVETAALEVPERAVQPRAPKKPIA